MDLGHYAQSCANAYRDIGEINGWRKGRNSSRGYDALTVPSGAWDDRPHERYLLVVHGHLSSAAAHLAACGHSFAAGNFGPVVTLARAAFVESSKAAWLLEDGVMWTHRAARAHVELLGNLEMQVRRLPKRLDNGYPNFVRKQWQVNRKQLRDEVIVDLFGKRGLSREGDDLALVGEELLTASQLEEQFTALIGVDALSGAYVVAPDLLVDPTASISVELETLLGVDTALSARSVAIAIDAWLAGLGAWVHYNAWGTGRVDELKDELSNLAGVVPDN
ncbi:MAG: hypothetical protein ABI658_16355 [Acidimicrobiales bacterium]